MKKLLTLIVLAITLFTAPAAMGQVEWVTANQVTIGWDAANTTESGGTIPATDAISYRVYTKRLPNGEEVVVGETAELTYTITFTVEGRYIAGVKTLRVPEGETVIYESPITWSNSEDPVAVPNPFAFVYYESPSAPAGLSRTP